jgi:tetratricopeptide (TPR) repeat protein
MKRVLVSFLLVISLVLPLCAAETDSQLYTRLSSAYDSGYYPTVLTLSEKFLSDFPHSQFADRVHFIRGKSFFRLSRYTEAIKDFEFVAATNADAAYWQGMAYYRLQNYEASCGAFYNALALISDNSAAASSGTEASVTGDLGASATGARGGYDFSKRSLLVYAAFSLDNCDRRDEAAAVLEYTLINFNMEEDFQPAVQLLFSIYKDTANKERLRWLYRQISAVIECFPKEWSHAMLYYMADAYSDAGEYERAIELFGKLIACDEKAYQAAALQNSYVIAEEKAFSPDGGRIFSAFSVLENAAKYFAEGDVQLCDLWMKLAIRNWNDGEKETAILCFEKADSCGGKALEGGAGNDTLRIQKYMDLSRLYEAEYQFDGSKKEEAIKLLKDHADSSGDNYPEYWVRLAQYSALTGKSDDCGVYAQKAVEKLEKKLGAAGTGNGVATSSAGNTDATNAAGADETTKKLAAEAYFYQAYAAAEKKDWKSVLAACRKRYQVVQAYDYPQSLLFAESLLLADGSESAVTEAIGIFEALSDQESGIAFLSDRTKALLLTGNYETAYKLGGTVRSADADSEYLYLMGLAATGCGVWKTASNLLGTDKPYGLYYTAYALYRQSRTDEAYPLFERFFNENPYHLMARNACFYAAVCALQNDEGDNALKFAKLAVEQSSRPEQKMEASVLCASIYNDKNMYAEAETLLEVYAPSTESVSLNLLLSQVYSAHAAVCKRNEDFALYTFLLEKADKLLANTESYFRNITESRAAAEEAAYRRAELYYSAAEYEKAADIYEQFRENYPESTFYVQSLFYNALSLKNTGREKEAILLFEKCASYNKYNDTFGFPALRQLIELYRNSAEYEKALAVAERALLEYPEESKYSGIATTVQNLKLMVAGTDETIAALKTKYEDSGRSSTSAGRKNGFSLALEYMNTVSERSKGEAVLLDIIGASKQSGLSSDDRFIIGESYELLGLYYRQLGRESDATECYLSAAECFASVDKGKAAEVLYNAIDIFVAEGRRADAEAVYRTLVSLDSGSQWAKEAATLLGIF